MKQLSVTLLSLLLMASSTPRPPQLLGVLPPEGSTQTYVEGVAAALSFTAEEEADLRSFQLFVDGVDVTTKAQIGSTRDEGPSSLGITYAPEGFQPGIHHADGFPKLVERSR